MDLTGNPKYIKTVKCSSRVEFDVSHNISLCIYIKKNSDIHNTVKCRMVCKYIFCTKKSCNKGTLPRITMVYLLPLILNITSQNHPALTKDNKIAKFYTSRYVTWTFSLDIN